MDTSAVRSSGREDARPRGEIAVIGVGCRFPGGIDSLSGLWKLLDTKDHTIGPVPADRWTPETLKELPPDVAERMRWGSFLEDVFSYEPDFFGISEHEAPWVDPQHRLLLEVAWEACEHAGIPPTSLAGERVGTFFGLYSRDYLLRSQRPLEDTDPYAIHSGTDSMAAGRLAFLLNLQGPQLTMETGCASGLVAVHTACQSLLNGESNMALAGAASLTLDPEGTVLPARWSFFSPTGRCHSFDAAADGYVRGEGCAVVVLKRLSDARRDGDRVLAVVRGSAVNQNGRRSSRLMATSQTAQADVYREALDHAGIRAGQVGLVEAHGPGTAVGDPLEFAAIAAVYGQGEGPCAVGSVKTNIGHTEPVAGLASLLKAVCCLRHGAVAPNLHFHDLNPEIDAADTRLYVPTESHPWGVPGPRRAAVSSFSVSGTNCHVIMEEPEEPGDGEENHPEEGGEQRAEDGGGGSRDSGSAAGERVFLLSGGTRSATRTAAGRLADWLEGEGTTAPLADVAHTLATRRTHARHRVGVVAGRRSTLVDRLRAYAAESPGEGVTADKVVAEAGQGPLWVFSGHGSQWAGMCAGLLDSEAVFTSVIDTLEPLIGAETGLSLRKTLTSRAEISAMGTVQPVIFAVQLGLAAMWRAHGVEPAAVVGHSMGEVAAAVTAGALSLEDGVRVICRRSRLVERTAGQGVMASVELSRSEVEDDLARAGADGVAVAVEAAPRSTVVGGDAAQVERLVDEWKAREVMAAPISVEIASHTAQMDPILAELRDALSGVQPRKPDLPFYSTVADDPRAPVECDGAYWATNLRSTVRLARAVGAAVEDGHRLFVEISPHPLLGQAVRSTAAEHTHTRTTYVPSLLRETPEKPTFLGHLAGAHCAGHPVDWQRPYGAGRLADAPPTSWERRTYQIDRPARAAASPEQEGGHHPLTGPRVLDPDGENRHLWQATLSSATLPWLGDHRINGVPVLPGAAFCEMALSAATDIFESGMRQVEVTDVELRQFLPLRGDTEVTATATVRGQGRGTWKLTVPDADGAGRCHATAELRLIEEARTEDTEHPPDRDLAALKAGHDETVDPSGLYAQMRQERGIEHGPAFAGITALAVRGGKGPVTALADIELPAGARIGARRLHWHPVLLDVGLQVAGAAWFATTAVESGSMVPRRIGLLRAYGDVVDARHCHVRLDHVDAHACTAHLQLLSGSGEVLAEASGVEFVQVPSHTPEEQFDSRLLRTVWEEAPLDSSPERPASAWTLCPEPETTDQAAALAEALGAHAAHATVLPLPHPATADTDAFTARLRTCLQEGEAVERNVVYLPARDTAADAGSPEQARDRVLRLIRLAQPLADPALAQETPARLWTVTCAAQEVVEGDQPLLGQAGLQGLCRVLSYEHAELRPTVIDIEPATSPEELAGELLACPPDQDQIAHRAHTRLLARLHNVPMARDERQLRTVDWSRDNVTLQRGAVRTTSTVELVAGARRAPGPEEIEIALEATSINFGNVLQALGTLDRFRTPEGGAPTPFFDGAGTVAAVGENVTDVQVGDRVAALVYRGDGRLDSLMSRRVCVRADAALQVPDWMDLTTAAGLPAACMTAWYALRHLARLRAGETVLIHSASGGTGLAAVHIARLCGAEIIATAGSAAKRDYLREQGLTHVLDSRDPDFADKVRELTEDRGVDVVLNALTGAAQAAGLDALARQGRFIELGKRDIYADSRIGLLPFRRNITMSSVDLVLLRQTDPALIARIVRELGEALRGGDLPPLPVTTHPVTEAAEPFHTMAAARHTGKLVLTWPTEGTTTLPVDPEDVEVVRTDGTYLVTGGLGGLGLLLARRLADLGASAIVLNSRSEPDEDTRTVIEELRATGTRVEVVSGDISAAGVVAEAVTAAKACGHPLRGVVHAAAVVEDAIATNIDPALLDRVWTPKATGAWRLHEATAGLPELDWWAVFSSESSLLGRPGQGSYAAANAWLDEFAAWRRAQGLPAVSINWGGWAEHGRGAYNEQLGYTMIRPAEGLAALEKILAHGRPRTGYGVADLALRTASHPDTAALAFFAPLIGTDGGKGGSGGLAAELAHCAEDDRRALLRECVTGHLVEMFRLDPDEFDPHTSLVSLGLDSLLALQLRNRIGRDTALEFPATAMWTHPTVEALTAHLLSLLTDTQSAEGEQDTPPAPLASDDAARN
ncbi:SDR family NAD(P)-dependent oxidoreductase [Streptomyces sp. AA1529]|uniref:SDR family NAD(P)-dependent oxidoreductase n=1 Tax=Streptomyces sp. AA1529 TaxID=1203257 RepID=UPI003D746103